MKKLVKNPFYLLGSYIGFTIGLIFPTFFLDTMGWPSAYIFYVNFFLRFNFINILISLIYPILGFFVGYAFHRYFKKK